MKMLIAIALVLAGIVPASGVICENTIARSLDNASWGGLDPNSPGSYWPGFNYLTPVSIVLTSPQSISGITCGNDTLAGRDKGGDNKPMGQLVDTTLDSCGWADAMAQNYSEQGQWRLAYDTIRYYVEHCYMRDNSDELWSTLFPNIEEEVLKNASKDSLLAMRTWLLSVRNLNPANGWYCAVVNALGGTYPDNFDAGMAISKFLIDNPRCGADSRFAEGYDELSHARKLVWADTDAHPNTDTMDTTLPSLHELGLDSLLYDAASGVGPSASGSQIPWNARITTNPFPQSTALAISIGQEAWVKIGVYDVLGRSIEGANYSGVFEPGSRNIPLDLSNAPPGTYYVRISTANNEVRTLKITKQ